MEWMTIQEYAESVGIKIRAAKTRVQHPEKWGIIIERKKTNNGPGRKTVFIAKKSAVEKSAVEKSAVEKSAVEKSAVEKSAVEKSAVEKSAVEKSAVEKSAVEKSAVEKSAVEKSAVEANINRKELGVETTKKIGQTTKKEQANIIQFPRKPEAEKEEAPNNPIDLMTHFESLKKKQLPIKEIFEKLLHKKTLCRKSKAAVRQMRSVYRRQFEALGCKEIPPGLLHSDGRKNSGRQKKGLDPKIAERFKEMVIAASDPANGEEFLSRPFRRVVHFHKCLEEEFDTKIPLTSIYRAKKRMNLRQYFERPDSDKDNVRKDNGKYFKSVPVYDLVQMDGSPCKSFKLKYKNGYKQPCVINLQDTGSRCILAGDFYWSESSENSIDVMIRWFKAHRLPLKKIKFRPDNAGGFRNVERPLQELNYTHSEPGGFVFDFHPAHAYAPKEKVHKEREYGTFRTFEAWVQRKIKDRYVKMEEGVVFLKNGGREHRKMKCYDITLEELKEMNLYEQYMAEYNNKPHRFTEDGVRKTWVPQERLEKFIADHSTLQVGQDLLDLFIQYGKDKRDGTVRKEGGIVYDHREWVVTSGDFSQIRSTKVKISVDGDRLILFEPQAGGVKIGEAVPKTAPSTKDVAAAEARSEKRVKKIHEKISTDVRSEAFRKIKERFDTFGMKYAEASLEHLFKSGLTLEIVNHLLQEHEQRYKSRMTGQWINIVFNLFITDFRSYQKQQKTTKRVPRPKYASKPDTEALPLAVNQ